MTLSVQAVYHFQSVVSEEEAVLEADKPKIAFFEALKKREFFTDFCDRFAKTPHRCFQAICEKLGGIVRLKVKDPALPGMIQSLLESRKKYQETLVPVCTSCEEGEIPTIAMMPKSDVSHYSRLKNGNIYLSPTAYGQYAQKKYQTPKLPTNKEELDAFVNKLFIQTNGLIAWDRLSRGCNRRAQFLIDLLALYGFPQEKLGKQYMHFPDGCHWSYHVAPVITMDIDGKPASFVIDLTPKFSLNAYSLEGWMTDLKGKDTPHPTPITQLKGAGERISLEPKGYTTYCTGIDTVITIAANGRSATIHLLDEERRDEQISTLVKDDYAFIEREWLRDQNIPTVFE